MLESHATKSASKIFKTGSTLFFCFFSVSVASFCWNRNEIYRKKHAETEQKQKKRVEPVLNILLTDLVA